MTLTELTKVYEPRDIRLNCYSCGKDLLCIISSDHYTSYSNNLSCNNHTLYTFKQNTFKCGLPIKFTVFKSCLYFLLRLFNNVLSTA